MYSHISRLNYLTENLSGFHLQVVVVWASNNLLPDQWDSCHRNVDSDRPISATDDVWQLETSHFLCVKSNSPSPILIYSQCSGSIIREPTYSPYYIKWSPLCFVNTSVNILSTAETLQPFNAILATTMGKKNSLVLICNIYSSLRKTTLISWFYYGKKRLYSHAKPFCC